jgi:flagellar motor switch protein FliG
LQETHTQRITPLLQDEHPQTIAVVISHLAPDRAAEVLDTLQSELQVDVIRRLVDLDEAHPEVVRDIERGLKSRIVAHVRDERRRCAGMKAVSGILAAARPRTKRAILSNLALHDGRLAGRLVRRKFDFEDLGRLELDALAAVVAAVPNEVLLLALATAAPELTNRLLRTLPTTEARAMRRSLDTLGPTRLSDVEQAQAELARVAQQLEREGRIEILVGQELV